MNIIQYDDQTRPIYAKCINQVKEHTPSGVKHTLITKCGYDLRNKDYRCASEIVRLTEATINPDMLWLDSDCLIKKWPDFEFVQGRPYCSAKWWEAIFYVNGCCDFFKSLLNEYDNNMLHKSCWLRKLFMDHRKDFNIIPEGYFVHMALSTVIHNNNFSKYGSKDYSVHRNDNGDLDVDIRF